MERTARLDKASDADKLSIVGHYAAFVFDLDGTVWQGSALIPGAAEAIDLLRSQGKGVFFITNSSCLSRRDCLLKLQGLGVKASLEEVYVSAYAVALFLKARGFREKAYVIGERGLVEELRSAGIRTLGGPEDTQREVAAESHMETDDEVGAVVVGLDRGLNYFKVQYAASCLAKSDECLFLATNIDTRGNRTDWPGAGAMVGAVLGATEAEPIVVGKPSILLLEAICKAASLAREKVCVVGDDLEADVTWATAYGCGAVLVLSGVTSEAQLRQHQSSGPGPTAIPTCYMDSIADLLSIQDMLPTGRCSGGGWGRYLQTLVGLPIEQPAR